MWSACDPMFRQYRTIRYTNSLIPHCFYINQWTVLVETHHDSSMKVEAYRYGIQSVDTSMYTNPWTVEYDHSLFFFCLKYFE